MSQQTTVTDESRDRAYFVVTPQLVWAMCGDTYEFTLWSVVKMIAGEDGVCTLVTKDLANLAMMSAGKCAKVRAALIRKKLLTGSLYRDPGYPQPVWHLSIPDLWEHNVAWRQQNHSLRERIAWKREQRMHPDLGSPAHERSLDERGPAPGEGGVSYSEQGLSLCEQGLSPGERGHTPEVGGHTQEAGGVASGEEGLSPSEQGLSLDERGLSPGETKKNQEEIEKKDLQVEPERTGAQLWAEANTLLARQMPRASYDTWIATCSLTWHPTEDPPRAIVHCPSAHVQDWLQHRMDVVVARTLRATAERPDLVVTYRVADETF